jgi:hypothetical protein
MLYHYSDSSKNVTGRDQSSCITTSAVLKTRHKTQGFTIKWGSTAVPIGLAVIHTVNENL